MAMAVTIKLLDSRCVAQGGCCSLHWCRYLRSDTATDALFLAACVFAVRGSKEA